MREAAVRARQEGPHAAWSGHAGALWRDVRALAGTAAEPLLEAESAAQDPPAHRSPLSDALGAFAATQRDARGSCAKHADLDLAGVTFANPFIPGVRCSLATGLHVIVAHEKRRL